MMKNQVTKEGEEAKEPPRYKHDCYYALFLGRYHEFDLYYCDHWESAIMHTVVARFGDKPHEYISGMLNASYDDALQEALRRVIELGLKKS